jgi:hypothetical protein
VRNEREHRSAAGHSYRTADSIRSCPGLADEFQAIHGRPLPAADEATHRQDVAQIGQSALCRSGGGIRSASFSLGVIQALARAK